MSHKNAKRIRHIIRFFLREGMTPNDPRIPRWAEATPRQARRAITVIQRKGEAK